MRFLPLKVKLTDFVIRCRSGMAATEFAVLLPVMVMLFFGMLEASDALTVNRRVSNASNAIVDLVGQAQRTTPDEIESIFTGAEKMLAPNDVSSLDMKLSSVIRDPNDPDKLIVDWSLDSNGEEPYDEGEEFTAVQDDTVVLENMSILVAETSYMYTSGFSNKVLGQPISFSKTAKRIPRLTTQVVMCPNSNPECGT